MGRDVRVALVGDEAVGKSTIICALIKESFIDLPPRSYLPEVSIPPEVTPEANVTTYVTDTSPRYEDRAHLENEIRKSHVVCIVYAVDSPSSFERISAYWLPLIRGLGVNVPVILCGNKMDLRAGDITNEALEEEVLPVISEFKEVETCVECSAKIPLNVPEVFYFAQKAVLHPTAPLYDSREQSLKPGCVAALRRIFHISDMNKDGILDDTEINEFQRKCFGTSLQTNELSGVKESLISAFPQLAGSETPLVVNGGLTELGFVYLQMLFIQRARLETTWTVLRKFGYGTDLSLRDEFLNPRFDVQSDCSVELSPSGYQFFTELFETFDKDKDGALKREELDNLFSTSPGNPWTDIGFPNTTVTDENGAVTLRGWLAQWSMTTLLDHRLTLQYLAYLGFPHTPNASQVSTTQALTVTKPRRSERRNGKVSRNVFLCYVLGAAGCGKTALLRNFVGKDFRRQYEPTKGTQSVVGEVEIRGQQKYLVLQEFGSNYEPEVLRNNRKIAAADVIVFAYDSSDTNSFSYISNLRQQYKLDSVPSMFVATKSDLDLAQQRHEVQPEVYCRKLLLAPPVAVSIRNRQTAGLFTTMCNVALHPLAWIPGGADRPIRLSYYLSITALVGASGAVAIILYRQMSRGGSVNFLHGWFQSLASPKREL